MIWLDAINQLVAADCPHVVVTVIGVKGSAPRKIGAKLVVDAQQSYDTIGGGNLEFEAISMASDMLLNTPVAVDSDSTADSESAKQPAGNTVHQQSFTLGNDLSQCCGGHVTLLFEYFPSLRPSVAVFGAGHVGQALAQILVQLPFRLTVFDDRTEFLQQAVENLPRAYRAKCLTSTMPQPALAAEQCPLGTWFIVMTHSHDIDFELVEAILSRDSSEWCGLIASRSKAAKFRQRLSKKGFSAVELSRLVAPIGLSELTGREPMAVATSVAAQLLLLTQGGGDGALPKVVNQGVVSQRVEVD